MTEHEISNEIVPVPRAKYEALCRDKVRLDWMEANAWQAYRTIEDAGYRCDSWQSPSYRAAIDEAMTRKAVK